MGTPTLWIGFNLAVLLLLAVDLGIFSRRARASTMVESALWSAVWIALSLGFNFWIWQQHGAKPGLEFFTGYLIEKSLSVDNLFLFAVVFRYFSVAPQHQHRVLYWGVLGALVMRGGLIAAGAALIHRFAWVLELFGVFLIYASIKMMLHSGKPVHPEKNPVIRWVRKVVPLASDYAGERFFIRRGGVWLATPLLLVLVVLETVDLTFALDSIPAVFSITRDPFIVYSSNVCAILGLRALYFLLARVMPYFRYLDKGLSIVLLFVGAKLLIERWLRIPTGISLLIVVAVLAVATAASLLAPRAPMPTEVNPSKKVDSKGLNAGA